MVGASLRAARCRWLTTRHFLAPVAVLAFISINWRLVAADCSGGLFQTQVKYVTSDGPHGATLADFNRDGILDIAVANLGGYESHGNVVVRLGRGSGGVGDGTFGPPVAFAAGVGPSGLTSGDFNEYGNVDLAIVLPIVERPFAEVPSAESLPLLRDRDGRFRPRRHPRSRGAEQRNQRGVRAARAWFGRRR